MRHMGNELGFVIVLIYLVGVGLTLLVLWAIIRSAVLSAGRVLAREAGLIEAPTTPTTVVREAPAPVMPTPDNPQPNSAAVKQMLREQRGK